MSLPRTSVNNPILVNLLMFTVLGGGTYCAFTLVREMFPEYNPNQVMINTTYPGATPAEVEKGISIKIEEQVKDLEGIDELHTTIGEGFSSIMIVLRPDYDKLDQAVTDARDAVDAIPRDDFPEEAEETIVRRFEAKLPVIQASLFGDLDDAALKELGERLRDDILDVPGITDVVLSGTRRDEISVEVHPNELIKHQLSFLEVGDAIRRTNLDLPGGQVKTAGANVAVRTLGESDRAEVIGDIVVRSDPTGKVIRLRDVATVIDGFEDTDVLGRLDGRPAVSATVYKTADQDAIDISRKVRALLAGKQGQTLEENGLTGWFGPGSQVEEIYREALRNPYPELAGRAKLKTHMNLARFIEGRMDLLRRNGAWGLLLVFVSLLLFLNWRIAFWVMMGLLFAILGTLLAMKAFGLTLNLISMFGLIVVLGLLVDDAIIVAEHVYTKIESGVPPRQAAIDGAEEVTKPVTVAIATTIMAFAPLLFVEGQMGAFMSVLPWIVMCALSISLFEALSILPSHLAEWLRPIDAKRRAASRFGARFRRAGERIRSAQRHVLQNVLIGGYERLLRKAVSYRYVTVAAAVACLIVAVAAELGGHVPFVFFGKMDAETLTADVKMPVGTPIERTDAVMKTVEKSVMALPELDTAYTLVGAAVDMWSATASSNTHLGQCIVELKPIEERERNSEEILRELRAKTASIPGVNSLRFGNPHAGPGGAPIDIEISGDRLGDLLTVTDRVKGRLRDFAGVFDIADDFDAGRREVQIELLDSARALGLTTESLATQVRAAFYGLEARKVQRAREDVKIMVRYPPQTRRLIYDVESMRIAAPNGQLVPFCEVARLTEGRGFSTIKRLDQKRTVTVTADVDEATTNSQQVLATLEREYPELAAEFPGVSFELGGQSREFTRAFASLQRDMIIAVVLIYATLAGLFKSYVQPLIVMAVIPFGIVGAVAGHFVMGFDLTILSLIGLVALTGIVVNDSLILVDFINRRRAAGVPVVEAVVDGGKARIRAIILTSITTILGLAPLLMETSFQARFLIPMGISISFGLAFATLLTLVLVPALYVIVHDVRRGLAATRRLFPTIVPPREGERAKL